MSTLAPEMESIEVLAKETQRLRSENAALQMALSVARRERDEWRTLAEQCGPLGGEVDDWVDSPFIPEEALCAC